MALPPSNGYGYGRILMGWLLRLLPPLMDEEATRGSCAGSISCCPIPRSFNLETTMGIWKAHLFSFFGGYGAWGSTPLQLLLSGGMACVVATCHAKIDWGILGSNETFQFSYVFWGTSFLNPLCFLSVPTFSISQLLLCLFPLPQLLLCLLLWFPSSFCTHPFDFSVSPSFLGTPFVFLFFLSF